MYSDHKRLRPASSTTNGAPTTIIFHDRSAIIDTVRRTWSECAVVAASPSSPPPSERFAGATGRRLITNAVLVARFLPVWLATGALVVTAAIAAPDALGSTSRSFVLPTATVLALAALGQMLVVMQGGIDLSTPGVMSLSRSVVRPGPTMTGMGMTWDADTTGTVLEDWVKWGVARHPCFLRPEDVAEVISTVVHTPRGCQLTLVEVQPEKAVEKAASR